MHLSWSSRSAGRKFVERRSSPWSPDLMSLLQSSPIYFKYHENTGSPRIARIWNLKKRKMCVIFELYIHILWNRIEKLFSFWKLCYFINSRSHVSEGPTVKTFVAHCAWSLELPPRPFYFHYTLHYILHPVPVHYAADSKRRRYHVATRRHTVGLNCKNPPKIRLKKSWNWLSHTYSFNGLTNFEKWAASNDRRRKCSESACKRIVKSL